MSCYHHKVTRKPRQPRRVPTRCASTMKGRMKTLFTQRYRGSVKVRWFHICSPRSPLTWLHKISTLPLPATKALISPHPFPEISLPTQMWYPFLKTSIFLLSFKAWYMTISVGRPIKGTLRKKIRLYATQSKKVKKTRKPNCFFCSCARKKLNQSRKLYQNMRQSPRRRQNQERR